MRPCDCAKVTEPPPSCRRSKSDRPWAAAADVERRNERQSAANVIKDAAVLKPRRVAYIVFSLKIDEWSMKVREISRRVLDDLNPQVVGPVRIRTPRCVTLRNLPIYPYRAQ